MQGNIGVRDSVREGGLEWSLREGMPGRGEERRGVGELPAPLFICFLSGPPLPSVALSKCCKERRRQGCVCEGWGSRRLPADQPPGLSSESFPAPSGGGAWLMEKEGHEGDPSAPATGLDGAGWALRRALTLGSGGLCFIWNDCYFPPLLCRSYPGPSLPSVWSLL